MTRELVTFSKEEVGKRIVVFRNGTITTLEKEGARNVIASLRPNDLIDFVCLPDGRKTLVVSDMPIGNAEFLFGKGAKLVAPQDIPVSAESWVLPLAMPALLTRVFEDDTQAWYALDICGQYLEKNAWSDQTSPWKRGLVAAGVRAHWKEWRSRGLVSGESHWGWIKSHYFIENGDETWRGAKDKFDVWMRCADVFLRNVENRDWIARLTLNEILEIPISKANRCCGAIAQGLFDFSADARRALFDPRIRVSDMNHIVSRLVAHRDDMPQKVVDEETGEIQLVVPATGEVVEKPDPHALDKFVPSVEEIVKDRGGVPRAGIYWSFDWERMTFGYWEEGEWIPGLTVVNHDDVVIRHFVDQIIARCDVAADYDEGD